MKHSSYKKLLQGIPPRSEFSGIYLVSWEEANCARKFPQSHFLLNQGAGFGQTSTNKAIFRDISAVASCSLLGVFLHGGAIALEKWWADVNKALPFQAARASWHVHEGMQGAAPPLTTPAVAPQGRCCYALPSTALPHQWAWEEKKIQPNISLMWWEEGYWSWVYSILCRNASEYVGLQLPSSRSPPLCAISWLCWEC